MHQCLTIHEILTTIFTCIYQEWPPPEFFQRILKNPLKEERQTLARLARTCKAFHHPAIDTLWYHQPSLFPLIQCLPSDAYSFTPEKDALTLTRNLRITEWERIEFYACRIKALGPSASEGATLHSDVAWSRRPHSDRPLLPGVRHAHFNINDFADSALYPRLAVGPTLQSVHIQFVIDHRKAAPSFDNVLPVLRASSPALKSFSIGACFYGKDLSKYYINTCPDLMDLVQCLKDIEVLRLLPCKDLTDDALAHIAAMPKLRQLSIGVDVNDLALFLSRVPKSAPCFKSIRKLKVTAQDLNSCLQVIVYQHLPQLESLSITRRCALVDVWDLHLFFETLRDHCSQSAFNSVNLHGRDYRYRSPHESQIAIVAFTATTILPLLSFTNMVSIKLDLDNRFDMDDNTLQVISEAWPQLRTLRFIERTAGRPCKITLQGLLPLVENCPDLEDLCLRVDATQALPASTSWQGKITGHKLRSFGVCTSPLSVECVPSVIDLLTTVFPGIQEIHHGWGPITLPCAAKGFKKWAHMGFYHSWLTVVDRMDPILKLNRNRHLSYAN